MVVVPQGLMHHLSACHIETVWRSYGSWLCTLRKDVAPSKLVVMLAVLNTLCEFLAVGSITTKLAKFIARRQTHEKQDRWDFAAWKSHHSIVKIYFKLFSGGRCCLNLIYTSWVLPNAVRPHFFIGFHSSGVFLLQSSKNHIIFITPTGKTQALSAISTCIATMILRLFMQ